MKMKFNFFLIIGLFLLYTVSYILAMHFRTSKEIYTLKQLSGQHCILNVLQKKFPKLELLTDPKEINYISKFMHIEIPKNVVVFKSNGKGIPYYFGIILLDTTANEITNVFIEELQ
jgi:hypothetical protein